MIRGLAVLTAAGLFIGSGGPVAAGPQKAPAKVTAPKPAGTNPMNLSAAQTKKLEAIQKKYQPQVQSLLNSKITDAEKQKRFMALSQKIEKEVDAILTPQQRQQKNKLQAQALQQQKAVQAQMQKQAQREAAVYKSLTPAQKKKIDAINQDTRTRATAIQNDKKLTQQQKNDKLRAMITELQKKRLAVLTPQQRAKLTAK